MPGGVRERTPGRACGVSGLQAQPPGDAPAIGRIQACKVLHHLVLDLDRHRLEAADDVGDQALLLVGR